MLYFFLHSTFDVLPTLLFGKFPIPIPTSIYTSILQYFTSHIKCIIHRSEQFWFKKYKKKLCPVNIDSNIVMLLANGSTTRYKFVMTRADDKCLFFKSPRNSAGARVKLVKSKYIGTGKNSNRTVLKCPICATLPPSRLL